MLSGLGLSGTALAESNTGSTGKSTPKVVLLAKNNGAELYKVEYEGQVSVYQKDDVGAIVKTPIGDATEVQSVSAIDATSVTVEKSGPSTTSVETTDVTTQGWEVIEQSSSFTRQIGGCKTDNGYRHQYDGVTFSLTKPADVIGKATLAETISVLISAGLTGTAATLLSFGTGIIAGAILSLYTGRHYTVAVKDGFVDWGAGYTPQINAVVANSYDAPASATTDVAFIPDAHLGGEHEFSGGIAGDNPWQK